MPKRLLIFSYHFPPSSEVAGKPTAKLVRRLPEHGWHATVLVPPSWAYFQLDPAGYAAIEQHARVEPTGLWPHPLHRRALARIRKAKSTSATNAPLTWSAIEERSEKKRRRWLPTAISKLVHRCGAVARDLTSIPDAYAGWVVPAYRHAARLLQHEQFDAILSVSPSVSAHLAALLLHRRRPELVWFAQFHDPWAIAPEFHPRIVAGLSQLDRRLEAAVVRRCDRVVCATEEALQRFDAAYRVGPRGFTLHNGFDPEDFPDPSRSVRTDNRLTFTYTGSLCFARDPKPFLDSVARLIRAGRLRPDQVRVCLIGDCERAQGRSVRAMAAELGLGSVVELIPPVPYPEALTWLSQSDVLLLFAEGQPLQVPAKLFEYLHLRRNVLAFCTGATARVVRETKSGQVVTSDQAELIDAAIMAAAEAHAASRPSVQEAVTEQIDRYRADSLAKTLANELDIALAERQRLDHSGMRRSIKAPLASPQVALQSGNSSSGSTGYRQRLRTVCDATGLTSLRWAQLRSGLYVFNYHRLGDPAECDYDRGTFSCSGARFREHLSLYRDRFEIVNLNEIRDIAAKGGPLQRRGRPLALITFDDGYADNYRVAFPILREFGMTAAFFVPTAFVGTSLLPWWDEIAWTLRHATVKHIALDGWDDHLDLRPEALERTILRVLVWVRSPERAPISERIAEIRAACRPDGPPLSSGPPLFVSWSQLREMHRAGMDIGSHSHSHPILSHLDSSAQRHELAHSKALLEAELAAPIIAVAYPVGKPMAYSAETVRIARSLDYKLGFNFSNVKNSKRIGDPYDIHRLAVDDDANRATLRARICFPWL